MPKRLRVGRLSGFPKNLTMNNLKILAFILLFLNIGNNFLHAKPLNLPGDILEIEAALDSSNLPIITINTNGQGIPDGTKITARMKVFNHKTGMNRITDIDPEYNGFIGIEIRGRFSTTFPQKPYGIETRDSLGNNLNVPLLGMPAGNDWILIPCYNDKSFARNILSFELFRSMGHYSVRARLCEVIINSSYRGIYVFCEKIKPDEDRVDIAKLTPADSSGNDLTGGYIISTDYSDGNNSWLSSYPPYDYPDRKVYYIYNYPKPDEITGAQKSYIQNFIKDAEGSVYGDNFINPQTGYKNYIDVLSFIDYFLVSEVSRNVDGYKKSRFFFKDRNDNDSLLHAGPVWDFDWAWKNIPECYYKNTDGSGWAYKNNDCNYYPANPDWHIRLLEDGEFTNQLIERYQSLRGNLLDLNNINSFLDSIRTYVNVAKNRHFAAYPISAVNAAPEVEPPSKSYDEEISKLKSWISKRIAWLDINIPKLRENIKFNIDSLHISLVNSGFEEPGTEKIKGWDGASADSLWGGLLYDIPGWTSDQPPFDSGIEQNGDGSWSAFLMSGDPPVYQLTNYSVQAGDNISLNVRAKSTFSINKLAISIYYLSNSNQKISLAAGYFTSSNEGKSYSVTFNASALPSSIGKKLGLQLQNVSSAKTWITIDDVGLVNLNPLSSVKEESIPSGYWLGQNYPNPFNPITNFEFHLPTEALAQAGTAESGHVEIKVYDIIGREVAVLVNEEKPAGEYSIRFDASSLASGVYFFRITSGKYSQTKKMILAK